MAAKKKRKAMRKPKRLTRDQQQAQHDQWITAQVNLMQENCRNLLEGIRAHLRTIEHKLTLDDASRADFRALRDAMQDLRRDVRRDIEFRTGARVPLRDC